MKNRYLLMLAIVVTGLVNAVTSVSDTTSQVANFSATNANATPTPVGSFVAKTCLPIDAYSGIITACSATVVQDALVTSSSGESVPTMQGVAEICLPRDAYDRIITACGQTVFQGALAASSLGKGQQVVNGTIETIGVVDTTIGKTESLANSDTVGAQALAPEDQAEKSGSTAPITFAQRGSNLIQSIKANAASAAGVIAMQVQSGWSWLKNKFNNDSSEYDKLMDDSFITTKAFLKEFLKGPKVSPDKMLSEIIQINKMLLKKLNHNNEEKDIYEKIVLKYQNNVFPLLLKQASNLEEPKGLFKKYQQNYLAIGRNFQDLLQQIMPEVSEKMLEFVVSVVNYTSQQGAGLFLDDDSNKLDDDVNKYDKLISDMFAANMALSKKFLKASDDNMFSEIVEIQTAYLKLWKKHQAEIVEMIKEFLLKFQEGPVAAPFGKLPSINGTQSSASVVVPALAPGSQTANG